VYDEALGLSVWLRALLLPQECAVVNLLNRDNPIINYIRETNAELRKVTWPTVEQARNLSLLVLGVTLSMSVLLGLVDFFFSSLFNTILQQFGH
jgi:preprotein translocase subunit SecE